MEIKSKFWIGIAGEPVFGKGKLSLLRAIDKHGSINQAAKEINISYRKAWGFITSMEQRLGIKLVDRHSGGKNGGGATITDEARDFLKKYELMEKNIQEVVDERFKQIFG